MSRVKVATAYTLRVPRGIAGIRASCILRHVVGLFHRVPGARAFRRHLSIASVKPGAGAEVLRDALSLIASGAAAAETAAA